MKQEQRRRILVIDDDMPILRVLSDFLSFRGFEVVLAESGEAGLEKIAAAPPDIILLDITMPGMGGIGFLRRIMSDSGELLYPVLVFTARTTTKDYFRGVPVDGFIAKPCDESELLDRILEILEKHKRAARKTILIGEDDRDIADRLIAAFATAGFELEEAATGPEILEKAAVCMPDAIMVKQILTGMNGESVACLLQAMPRTQSIPVLLYDASSTARNEEEWDRAGHHPVGIKKYLATDTTAALLEAVKGVLHLAAPLKVVTP